MTEERKSETPETDALATAPVDPAVNYASAKLTNALNLCASLERRLRAETQERARLQAELAEVSSALRVVNESDHKRISELQVELRALREQAASAAPSAREAALRCAKIVRSQAPGWNAEDVEQQIRAYAATLPAEPPAQASEQAESDREDYATLVRELANLADCPAPSPAQWIGIRAMANRLRETLDAARTAKPAEQRHGRKEPAMPSAPSAPAELPEKAMEKMVTAYRRAWRELATANPPHEGNATHEAALKAVILLTMSETEKRSADALAAQRDRIERQEAALRRLVECATVTVSLTSPTNSR